MKNLILVCLLSLSTTFLFAQHFPDDTGDASVQIMAGKNDDETQFWIVVEKKAGSIKIKYRFGNDAAHAAIKNDTAFNSLRSQFRNTKLGSPEREKLDKAFRQMIDRHRTFYQDSIILTEPTLRYYNQLLMHVARSKNQAFEGGTPYATDGDYLSMEISYQGKTKKIWKEHPLSIRGPLVYAFLTETLKIGREQGYRSVSEIENKFRYLF